MWQQEMFTDNENELKSVDLIEISRCAQDTFAGYNNLSLREFIEKNGQNNPSKIEFLAEELKWKCGFFLQSLKQNSDARYKEVLNPFGDKSFCKFKIEKNKLTESCGLYFFECKSELKYIGSTKQSFFKRINTGYGNISPRNCYRNGQSTNCKINSNLNYFLENSEQKDIKFYVLPIKDKEKILSTEMELIRKATSGLGYNLWNTQHHLQIVVT